MFTISPKVCVWWVRGGGGAIKQASTKVTFNTPVLK